MPQAASTGIPVRGPVPFQDRRITESSGVVASRKHGGMLWTMNDSGNGPVLFLTDTSGSALGSFRVAGASNRDWESLGIGRCGPEQCLYIGDTGDNAERRSSITLYRLPEPGPPHPISDGNVTGATALQVRYPDGPHDTEALYVEPDGAVMLITKGRRGGVKSYRIPDSAWTSGKSIEASLVDSLPIPASLATGRVVTDAAISRDGERVVIRTYQDLRFFTRNREGHLQSDPAMPVCDVTGLMRQGEGVDWWDSDTVVLTSERALGPAGTIALVRCPTR